MVDAILWVHRTGAPWRDIPSDYGPWQSVYTRFWRWSKTDIWQRVLATLSRERDAESYMIDSTIVRAHQDAAGAKAEGDDQALGRSRGGLSTKIHIVVDALGYPVDLRLTGGQAHDATQAAALLRGKRSQYVIADKAYDANAIVALITAQGAEPVIPPRRGTTPRKVDWHLYKERHLVECCINRLKRFRRLATRYEKTARSYLAMVTIACVLTWIEV